MLGNDTPARGRDEDTLDRWDFAGRLAASLIEADGRARGTVLGLTGSWGSGKSSVLNFVQAQIEDGIEARGADGPPVIVLRFDPWIFGATADLIERFFHDLAAVVQSVAKKPTASERLKRLPGQLWGYGRQAVTTVAAVGSTIIVPGSGGSVEKTMDHYLPGGDPGDAPLHKQREDLRDDLRAADLSIVVLIDELDRVEDADVRAVAQLVKSVADFGTISYLIAYDRDRVVQALGGDDPARGAAYLEKIVQFEVALPVATVKDLARSVRMLLTSLAGDELIVLPNPTTGRVAEILLAVLRPGLIDSPRAVKRWIAHFAAVEPMLRGEVDPVDLLAWSALTVVAPEVAAGAQACAIASVEAKGYDAPLGRASWKYVDGGSGTRQVRIEFDDHSFVFDPAPDSVGQLLSGLFPSSPQDSGAREAAYKAGQIDPRSLLHPRSLAMVARHGRHLAVPTFEDIRDALAERNALVGRCRMDAGFARALSDALIWDEGLADRNPVDLWLPLLDDQRGLAEGDLGDRLDAQWLATEVLARALMAVLARGTMTAKGFRAICETDRRNGPSDVLTHVLARLDDKSGTLADLPPDISMALTNDAYEMAAMLAAHVKTGNILHECALADWLRIVVERGIDGLDPTRALLENKTAFLRFGAAVFGRKDNDAARADFDYLDAQFGRDWLEARHRGVHVDVLALIAKGKDRSAADRAASRWAHVARSWLAVDIMFPDSSKAE